MVRPSTPQVVRFSPLVSVRRSPSKLGAVSMFTPQNNIRYLTRMDGVESGRKADYVDVSSLYRELDVIERDDVRKSRNGEPMDEDDLQWDEETTLAAMFEDKTVDVDERQELIALAEQLQEPMTAQAQKMRQHLRGSVIPAIERIKQVHDEMEDEVDLSFGKGVLAFDDACKRVEKEVLQDEDELRTAYTRMKQNTEKLVEQLQEAYHRRDRLWDDFEGELEQCAATARTAVETIPTEVEDTIAMLERKTKDMAKKENNLASKQKILKGLLEKL